MVLVSLLPAAVAGAGCNAPAAVADSADNYGASLVVDVLANDRDADGDALEARRVFPWAEGDGAGQEARAFSKAGAWSAASSSASSSRPWTSSIFPWKLSAIRVQLSTQSPQL